MGELITFVTVDNCLEAIAFYKEVFHAELVGEITMLENIPGMEKYKGKVGHATLKIGSNRIFINDALVDYPLVQGERIQLVLDMDTEENLKMAYEKLVNSGKVVTKLQEVHWGALFGSVKDQYGVIWQIYFGHK